MATTEDLFDGFAKLLQTAGVGRYIPDSDTTSVFASTDTAIKRSKLPASPDRAISLRPVPVTADHISPFSTVMVQAVTRGLPNDSIDAGNLAAAVKDTLLGLTDVWFGPTHVIQVRFGGSIDLDADESERDLWSTKFLVDVDEAPTILRPVGGAWD
jgi:hypothetical protein